MDQAFILHNVIQDRIARKLNTYCGFVDLEKCFDWIDRRLLYYKLLVNNASGKFYKAIKSLCTGIQAKVKLNSHTSEWFNVPCGLKQADNFSPQLASFYLNHMATDVKSLNKGVRYGNSSISILMYADDILCIAETESDLQSILSRFVSWCIKWLTNCNLVKTQVIHFRGSKKSRTKFKFRLFNEDLTVVPEYSYMGLVFDEFLTF